MVYNFIGVCVSEIGPIPFVLFFEGQDFKGIWIQDYSTEKRDDAGNRPKQGHHPRAPGLRQSTICLVGEHLRGGIYDLARFSSP